MTSETDNWKQVEEASRNALPDHVVEYIEQCRRRDHPDGMLIAVLHRVQHHFGYLGPEQLDAVAQLMQIPTAKVSGAASFYHYFRLQPPGRFKINICMGTACYVKGADRVADKLKEELGIDFGETTTDGQFTLEATRCLGSCGLAPIVTIDDRVYGQVTPDRIPSLIEETIKRGRKEMAPS